MDSKLLRMRSRFLPRGAALRGLRVLRGIKQNTTYVATYIKIRGSTGVHPPSRNDIVEIPFHFVPDPDSIRYDRPNVIHGMEIALVRVHR